MTQGEKPERKFFVRIRARTIEALSDLQKLWDLDVFRQTAKELEGGVFEIHGLLTEAEIEVTRSKGNEVEVVSDADEVARQRSNELRRQKDE
jgi:hypothetical protein